MPSAVYFQCNECIAVEYSVIAIITLGIRLAEADEMGAIGRLSAARASSSSSSSSSWVYLKAVKLRSSEFTDNSNYL